MGLIDEEELNVHALAPGVKVTTQENCSFSLNINVVDSSTVISHFMAPIEMIQNQATRVIADINSKIIEEQKNHKDKFHFRLLFSCRDL